MNSGWPGVPATRSPLSKLRNYRDNPRGTRAAIQRIVLFAEAPDHVDYQEYS